MRAPPAARPNTQPSIRQDDKEGRAEGAKGRVRITSEFGVVDVCDQSQLQKYLGAPNAEVIRAHSGRIVAIRLHSFGNDDGHSPERHGRSTVTTWREPLENARPLLQHKDQVCGTWPQPRASGGGGAA